MAEKTVKLVVDVATKNAAAAQQSIGNAVKPLAGAGGVPAVSGGGLPGIGALAGAGGLGEAGGMLGALGGIMAAAGPAAIALGAIAGSLTAMIELGKKGSPADAERFQRAWDDLMALIGRIFVPVLNAATDVLRTFADSMIIVGNTIGPVVAALVKFATATSPLLLLLKGINKIAGVEGASQGASGFKGGFTTAEEFNRQLASSAIASARGDPATETAKNTRDIKRVLEQIRDKKTGDDTERGPVGMQHG